MVGGGGAYYAYTVHTQDKKRAALRAQQARQARSQAVGQPQMRAAKNNPAQGGNASARTVNRPPQTANRPVQPIQNPAQTGKQPENASAQNNAAYLPPKPAAQKPAQDASRFKPVSSTAKQPSPTGETQTFTPVRGNHPTQVYQPIRPAATETKIPDSTDQWKPVQSAAPAMVEKGSVPHDAPVKASAPEAAPKPRVRRTERHKDMYDQNDKA